MEKIVENIRLHNIHALLVIGGFEVGERRGACGGNLGRRTKWPRASVSCWRGASPEGSQRSS